MNNCSFKKYSVNLRGRLVEIDRPWVMGIINATPDSFFAGSRVMDSDAIVERARTMIQDCADVLDIGACSTRPGAEVVTAEEEMRRLDIAVKAIRDAAPEVILSVDTYRADVARHCVEELGVDIINDQKYQTDFWSITDAGSNKGERVVDGWTPANSSSSIPALTTSNGADEGRMSSYFVENGSYVKLRTLQLGYTLPAAWARKVLLQKARVYVSGDNLLTVKSGSLTCSDPESTAWNYPHTASFTFGIQVSF